MFEIWEIWESSEKLEKLTIRYILKSLRICKKTDKSEIQNARKSDFFINSKKWALKCIIIKISEIFKPEISENKICLEKSEKNC